jgi:hypothetical protein
MEGKATLQALKPRRACVASTVGSEFLVEWPRARRGLKRTIKGSGGGRREKEKIAAREEKRERNGGRKQEEKDEEEKEEKEE